MNKNTVGSNMKKVLRAFAYTISRVAIVGVIIGLIFGAFLSSVKTSNLYFVIQDAMKARLDIILSDVKIEDKAQFFSYDYLQDAEYTELKNKYDFYTIAGYSHKFEFSDMFVWPWQTRKTITVREAVYALFGELDTSKITKEDAKAQGIDKIPGWEASEYHVTLVYEDDTWVIDSVKRVSDFDYQPPKTPSLTQEEIDALRTPSPAPTPTFNASQDFSGEHPATISTAIRGDKINVRIGPATEYDIIEKLENGAKVTVMDESDGWYLVKTENGNEGYVSGYYILFD